MPALHIYIVGVGWCVSSLGGVNISNASSTYLQPEIVISGSCNYPRCYLPSNPTSGRFIVLGSVSMLDYLNDQPFITCHGSQ